MYKVQIHACTGLHMELHLNAYVRHCYQGIWAILEMECQRYSKA